MSQPYRPTRLCRWCGTHYDPKQNSARQCPKNPHRRKGKPRMVTLGVMMLQDNPWAAKPAPRD